MLINVIENKLLNSLNNKKKKTNQCKSSTNKAHIRCVHAMTVYAQDMCIRKMCAIQIKHFEYLSLHRTIYSLQCVIVVYICSVHLICFTSFSFPFVSISLILHTFLSLFIHHHRHFLCAFHSRRLFKTFSFFPLKYISKSFQICTELHLLSFVHTCISSIWICGLYMFRMFHRQLNKR